MIASTFTDQTPIAEVLDRLPESAPLFIAKGTDCVGCALAPFCTIREMGLHYALDAEVFRQELAAIEAAR